MPTELMIVAAIALVTIGGFIGAKISSGKKPPQA